MGQDRSLTLQKSILQRGVDGAGEGGVLRRNLAGEELEDLPLGSMRYLQKFQLGGGNPVVRNW